MTESPAVSVIMTVYNGERYITQAIASIQQQDLRELELVIVDDGSDDDTPAILAKAQAADPRTKVISMGRVGRARALNVAWTHTRAPYVANLDADDLAEPERLRKQLIFLQQHADVGFLGTAWRVVGWDDAGRRIETVVDPPLTDSELRSALVRRNPFYHSSAMMPRRVLQEVGGYNEDYRVAIDYEVQVRIGCHYRLANLPDVLVTQREHGTNYFRSIPALARYRAVVKIRWLAWRGFSRQVAELPHVVNPTSMLRDYLGSGLRSIQYAGRGTSRSASK